MLHACQSCIPSWSRGQDERYNADAAIDSIVARLRVLMSGPIDGLAKKVDEMEVRASLKLWSRRPPSSFKVPEMLLHGH